MDCSNNWSDLPTDLLNLILDRFGKFSDFVRFCSVCQQWRYTGLNSNTNHRQSLQILKVSHNKLPMLIIQTKENNGGARDLFSFTDGVTYDLKLPWPYDYRFFGSSLGWLFCVDKAMAISLVNPFTRDSILLPVIEEPNVVLEDVWHEETSDYYTGKGILTSNPRVTPHDYTVVIQYGGYYELAIYKPGYDKWKKIESKAFQILDFISYNGHIYGIGLFDLLVKIDVDNATVITIIKRTKIKRPTISDEHATLPKVVYLVESQDRDLLQIQRFWKVADCDDDFLVETTKFKVFKLINNENSVASWVEIDDIGEQAIFVGDNQSVSVSTKEFPRCRVNCIYFTDVRHIHITPYIYRGPDLEDSGVFDLKDGSFHTHHKLLDSLQKHKLPPIWFVPDLMEVSNNSRFKEHEPSLRL